MCIRDRVERGRQAAGISCPNGPLPDGSSIRQNIPCLLYTSFSYSINPPIKIRGQAPACPRQTIYLVKSIFCSHSACISSVSYTHLDVYKRQVYTCIIPRVTIRCVKCILCTLIYPGRISHGCRSPHSSPATGSASGGQSVLSQNCTDRRYPDSIPFPPCSAECRLPCKNPA